MKKSLKVYLFRHGETTFNRDGRFTGWLDPHLTALGRRQAEKIAKKLKDKKFQVAFCTSLKRSIESLKPVLKGHPECKKIIKDDRMIERNYGDLNGISHDVFIKNIGRKLYKLEVEGDLITALEKKDRKKIKKFLGEEEYKLIHRGFNVPPPNGESFAQVEKRVKSFIKDLRKIMIKSKVNVAISAHGNSIRLFRKIMENASVEQTVKWVIPYDDFYEYRIKK